MCEKHFCYNDPHRGVKIELLQMCVCVCVFVCRRERGIFHVYRRKYAESEACEERTDRRVLNN
jgi:hypothetical protein